MKNTIYKLRKEKGLTQIELAKILNLDQTTVSKWENEKAVPDTTTLINLAEFFDVSTDYLLGRSTLYYPDYLTLNGERLSQVDHTVLTLFRDLPSDLQHRAIDYLSKLSTIYKDEKKLSTK